ncbi:glycerophosphodiester phosphodiesterase [Enterococcus sp. JM9B]|uniref:glycerophosphodiester phosphodiesterase n=1 Tax=Enterococcus sp. JM9B TaxID=1857216 RepID=UPI001375108E|nr:glycerophosphodiester phosphodiesterase [Enterococcus sp. JM9B]KAF1304860.1 hydrolase [Enterococcus sp. JM9B]
MHRKKRNYYKLFSLILFFLLILSIILNFYPLINTSKETAHVFSHRGASGEEVEHSYAAYDLAIQYGSKYIEQDLVTSKDGTLYVSHDLSAKRITGVNKYYSEMTDNEINQLKNISNGEPIHTLQSIFNRYKKQVHYVIELKENSQQVNLFKKIIKKNKLEKNVIVQASDIAPLNELDKQFPKMKKLLLINTQQELNKAISYKNVDIISINKKLLNKKNCNLVKKNEKELNVWTLDTSQDIETAIKLDVDNYFTNYTAKALYLEKKYR